MKLSKLIWLLFIALVFSCSQKKEPQIVINPDNFVLSELQLSEFSDEVSYIALSNTIPLRSIKTIEFCDGFIFIGARSEGLLVFNSDGSFKTQIGKKGKGPGEYFTVSTFSLDKTNKLVYVLDVVNKKKVIVYSFDGEFQYEFNNDQFEGNFQKIVYQNECIYLFEMIVNGNAKYNWVKLDNKGKQLSEKRNSVEGFNSMMTVMINPIYQFNNGIGFWNQYNDTIFRIENNKTTVRSVFADGKHRLPQTNSMELENCFMKNNILESENYFWINEFKRPKGNVVVIDKKSGDAFMVEANSNNENALAGLPNDIDAGVNFEPKSYFETKDGEYLVSWTDAFRLKAHVITEDFKNAVPKYPENKKELEKLANSLAENDNPVLMLVKLKK